LTPFFTGIALRTHAFITHRKMMIFPNLHVDSKEDIIQRVELVKKQGICGVFLIQHYMYDFRL